jgi:hypothetical protein
VGSVCSVLALGASLSSAGAQADPPSFSNGQASAIAHLARYAPGVGSLQLGINSGVTIAQVANHLAQSQAQTLDLGLIGTSLTAEQCDGSPGSVKASQLPQPINVDNRSGNTSQATDSYPVAGSALGGGHEEASATTDPAANASVSGVSSVLGALATFSGGRAKSSTRVVDGKAREAEATASGDLDIAGVVQLRGLEWRAFHRTGADPSVAGTFTVASASAGAVPLPSDQLGPLEDQVNALLAESGVTVEFPHVDHLTTPNDLIRVSPLTITMKDSPAGKTAFGPGLNLTRPQREQLFDTIVGYYCKAASVLLVGDISLDVISGTGFMTVEIGGVEAQSAELVQGNPFGDFTPLAPGTSETVAPNATFANGAPVAGPVTAVAPAPTADLGPLAAICETVHPAKRPLCSRGMGLPLAIGGVLATTGIGYLDWRRQRRLLSAGPVA